MRKFVRDFNQREILPNMFNKFGGVNPPLAVDTNKTSEMLVYNDSQRWEIKRRMIHYSSVVGKRSVVGVQKNWKLKGRTRSRDWAWGKGTLNNFRSRRLT